MNKINKLKTFKTAARLVVGAGTTTISNAIIKNNVQPSNPIELIAVGVSAIVIGSMASEATKSHTDAKIDAFVKSWNESKTKTDVTDPTPA